MTIRSFAPALACAAVLIWGLAAHGDTLNIGFETGEGSSGYTAGSAAIPQPNGAWTGGNSWHEASSTVYNESVTTAAAHSGTQSLLVSNSVLGSAIEGLESPATVNPAGAAGSGTGGPLPAGFNGTPPAGNNQFVQSFWFRTVNTAPVTGADPDPGLNIPIGTHDVLDQRQSLIDIKDVGGSLTITYSDPVNGTQTLAAGLTWGHWYRVNLVLTLNDSKTQVAAGVDTNDTAVVTLGDDTNALGTLGTVNGSSWENYYYTSGKAAGGGTYPGIDATCICLNTGDAPNGGNAPAGIYLDDLTMTSQAAQIAGVPLPAGVWTLIIGLGLVSLAATRKCMA